MRNRVLHVALLFAAALTMLGAGSSTTTLDRIGHKLECTCGCAEILAECNHVGCPNSGPMIDELRKDISAGQAEPAILNAFVAEYGPVVLAAPLRGGFDVVAWVVPVAVGWAGHCVCAASLAPAHATDSPACAAAGRGCAAGAYPPRHG